MPGPTKDQLDTMGLIAARVTRNTVEQTAKKMGVHVSFIAGAFATAALVEARRHGWKHQNLREAVDAVYAGGGN